MKSFNMMTKEVGGYFGLELKSGKEFHSASIHLNTDRNCFEYLIKTIKSKKIFIPYFICDTMLERLKINKINFEFYHIDNELSPIVSSEILKNNIFLYANYFGLKQNIVSNLSSKYTNLIIDNSQAFFSPHIMGINTFYSARKFFGVPDGAYLYKEKKKLIILEEDHSLYRMKHLLIRLDSGVEKGYKAFKLIEKSFMNLPVRAMSKLIRAVLCSISYEKVQSVCRQNFLYLHKKLQNINKIWINISNLNAHMVYPFMTNTKRLKEKFIKNKIFLATYWLNVLKLVDEDQLEYKLVNKILPLTIY